MGRDVVYFGCSLSGGSPVGSRATGIRKYLDALADVLPLSTGYADWREREEAWAAAESAAGRKPNVSARDFLDLERAGAMVADVTNPSLGLGREIERMLNGLVKPVLLLSANPITSKLLTHDDHPLLYLHEYSGESYKAAIDEFLWQSPQPAPIIVITGGDGAGKKTLTARLRKDLQDGGAPNYSVDYPRRVFRHGPRMDVPDRIYALLHGGHRLTPRLLSGEYAHDRDCVKGITRHLQNKGVVQILDRYYVDNWPYQGARLPPEDLKSFIEELRYQELEVNGIPPATLVLYLDVPVEMAHEAMVREGRVLDRNEQDLQFKRRVRTIYNQLADTEANWVRISAVEHGRRKTVEELASEVQPILEPLVAPFRRASPPLLVQAGLP